MQQYALYPQRRLLKAPIAQELPAPAEALRHKLRHCKQLMRRRVPWSEIADVTGMARSTYYRIAKKVAQLGTIGFIKQSTRPKCLRQSRVPQSVQDLVIKVRRENPTYGKFKIATILRRDHSVKESESTIGRIISKLLATGKIARSVSANRVKRSRQFNGGYAQRWQYGMRAKAPGELIQIDHMSVTINGIAFKHFQAWDPITKVIVAKVTSNATSMAAANFLQYVEEKMPFAIRSIQVDGGSEFMKHFEAECERRKIPLHVLPPRRPQWNGGVERGNRTFRDEFYDSKRLLADSVGAINAELQTALHKYNSYRPHSALKGLTPYAYNSALSLVDSQSHMY